jgi:hypothetical protein
MSVSGCEMGSHPDIENVGLEISCAVCPATMDDWTFHPVIRSVVEVWVGLVDVPPDELDPPEEPPPLPDEEETAPDGAPPDALPDDDALPDALPDDDAPLPDRSPGAPSAPSPLGGVVPQAQAKTIVIAKARQQWRAPFPSFIAQP